MESVFCKAYQTLSKTHLLKLNLACLVLNFVSIFELQRIIAYILHWELAVKLAKLLYKANVIITLVLLSWRNNKEKNMKKNKS